MQVQDDEGEEKWTKISVVVVCKGRASNVAFAVIV